MGEVSLPWDGADLTDDMGRKQVALLAVLAIASGPVPRDELATMLWPQSDRQAARHNLRQALVGIRKALGERADAAVVADPDAVALRQDAVRTDIGRLTEIAAGAETSPDEVLDLCRGPLLDGFALASPVFDERLEVWRPEAGALAIMAIDRALAGARARNRDALLARREKFVAQHTGSEMPQPPAPYRLTTRIESKARIVRSWRRTVGVVTAAFALGAGVMIAIYFAFIVDREVERLTVRPFTPGNGTIVEQRLAGAVPSTLSYGLQAIPEKKLVVVRASGDPALTNMSDAEFADRWDARYVISGMVEEDSGTVRVTVRCYDRDLDADVWSDRFEKPVRNPFLLPDDITQRILAELDIDLSKAERNRLQYLNDTENLEAWLYAVRGVSNLIKLTLGGLREANEAYSTALEIDPDYISARRGVVWHALLQVRFGMADDPDAAIREARDHLNVIIRRMPDHGMSRALEGFMLLLENSWDEAISASEESARLLPGSADVWAVLAHGYTYAGEYEKALAAIRQAKELSPAYPRFYDWIEGRALRLSGQTERAIGLLDQAVSPDEESLVRLVELAAAYMASDQKAAAVAVAHEIRLIDPDFRASTWVLHPQIQDPDLQSLEFELLSKAGL